MLLYAHFTSLFAFVQIFVACNATYKSLGGLVGRSVGWSHFGCEQGFFSKFIIVSLLEVCKKSLKVFD